MRNMYQNSGGGGQSYPLVKNRWGLTLAGGATHVAQPKSGSKIAFTLAEVLITLGVIGVVAAFTIPSLISNYQEKVRVNQVLATYSILSQAVNKMIEDEGTTVNNWGDTPESRIQKFKEILPKYIEIIRECDSYMENQFPKTDRCLGYEYVGVKLKENAAWARHIFDNGRYLLKNGSTLVINNGGSKCVQNLALANTGGGDNVSGINYKSYNTTCMMLSVDINGPTKPNKLGVDYFSFYVYQDGLGPAGRAQETVWTETFADQCLGNNVNKNSLREAACTAWVIVNKNMDYLHCPEKLGWNKQTSCK